MLKKDIKQGEQYFAQINGRIRRVRVNSIYEVPYMHGNKATRYDITNLETGRATTFRSAAKFIQRYEGMPFAATRQISKLLVTPTSQP